MSDIQTPCVHVGGKNVTGDNSGQIWNNQTMKLEIIC